MSSERRALVVATYDYADGGLRRLAAPARDADEFAAVLRNPEIAGFDVTMMVNEPHYVVGEAIAEFYGSCHHDDLSLLYFSGHGLKDDDGRLYLAMTNTRRDRLLFTGLSATTLNDAMDSCPSRRKVLILDCCYSGAFPAGRTAKADEGVHALENFPGKGRAVLTATDSTQYAFEGDDLRGSGAASVFTRYLVEAMRSGAADLNRDGDIDLGELYDYVRARVVAEMPQQRPKKQEDVEGRIVIARNVNWTLPDHLRNAIDSPWADQRLGALEGLAHLHRAGNEVVRAAVVERVRALADDDSRRVSKSAADLLARIRPAGTSAPHDPGASAPAAEERSHQEAEERSRREAAERSRREAEERARREERARQEAEKRSRRDAEERSRREAAERTRQEEERAAAERARREADQRGAEQREVEQRAAWEAEQRASDQAIREAAERQAQREAEQARTPVETVASERTGTPSRGVPLLALAVGGLSAVLGSRVFMFEVNYGYHASDLAWSAPMMVLGIAAPLAVAGALLVLRGNSPRAAALARGLVVGAALSLTHQVAVASVHFYEFESLYTPGPGFWLLVVGWALVVAAAVLALRVRTDGARSSPHLGLRIGCWLVLCGLGVGLAVAEGLSSFTTGESRLDWVLPVAAALVLTWVPLTDLQRITALTAVTVFGVWLVYIAMRALVQGWYLNPARSWAALGLVGLVVTASYVAQLGFRTSRWKGSVSGRR